MIHYPDHGSYMGIMLILNGKVASTQSFLFWRGSVVQVNTLEGD